MKDENLICVNCGAKANKLYTKYEKDVIKLSECSECGKLVDKYIEYDVILVHIDLILQYISSYRHLFVNSKYNSYWRVIVLFTMFDAYNKWTHERASLEMDLQLIYELEWQFYKSLLESAVELFTYSLTTLLFSLLLGFNISNYLSFLQISTCGFYGNSLLVFSIIWNLHDQFPFALAIQSFLTVSHFQVQRVLCPEMNKILVLLTVLIGTTIQNASGNVAKQLIVYLNW